MPLTDAKIRAAKPAEKRYELPDGAGLGLVVHPTGTKSWRLRYRVPGGQKAISLGRYPDVRLSRARNEASKLRARVASGEDPAAELDAQRVTGSTVDEVVELYVSERRPTWKASTTRTYLSAIGTFTRWAKRSRLKLAAQITPAALAQYRAYAVTLPRRAKAKGGSRSEVVSTGERRSARAINCDLRALKTMLQALRKAGRLPGITSANEITDNLGLLAVDRTRVDPLKPPQLRALLAAAMRHDAETWTVTHEHQGVRSEVGVVARYEPIAPLVAVMLLGGLRLGEALRLTWEDVDLPDQQIRILPSKTDRERSIDLTVSPALGRILDATKRRGDQAPFAHTQATALDARQRLIASYGAPAFLWSTRHSRPGARSAPTLRSTCGCYLTCAPSIFGSASVYRSAAQLGHAVQVAERHYLGALRRIPKDATTLEAAMRVEAELEELISRLGAA